MPNPFTLPKIPAELQAIIDADRERFAGWKMVADPPDAGSGDAGANGTSDAPDKGAPDKGDAGGKDDDEALGEAGKKTLEKERAARKELEKQVAGMKAFQDGLAKLVSPDGAQVKPEEALKQLADKVEQLTHSNLVKDIARDLGITEKADLDLLSEMKSEEQIRALAERLKPADDKGSKDDKSRQRRYQPDPSAGKGGGGGTGTDPREAGRAEARRRFGDPTKQTNQKD